MAGRAFGPLHLCGTESHVEVQFKDTYTAFRRQLVSFIDNLRRGTLPQPFSNTVEMTALVIAGLRSRTEGSRRVEVMEIISSL